MKSLLFCSLLFCVLVGFCIFSAFHITEIVRETEQLLIHAVRFHQKGDRNQAAEFVQQADACWEGRETVLGMLIRHDVIDEVEMEFAGLKAYANSDDDDDFLCTSAKLFSSLQHVREMEWPFIRNVF